MSQAETVLEWFADFALKGATVRHLSSKGPNAMYTNIRCGNMNHGRTNAPVRFCPMCGGKINMKITTRCDANKHASQRKDRLSFCCDCGEKLSK
jgi:hypothetical protein